ncbi:MAG TPA: VOC family protein [Kineosporiaceae bacterium]|nr:VOC family protein [Kineosporiaceae bacterium]
MTREVAGQSTKSTKSTTSTKEYDMVSTVQPVIVTPELDRLLSFYTGLLGAKEIDRVPADGPTFYVGLQIGNSTIGVVADAGVDLAAGDRQRILLSIDVDSVDTLLSQVESLGGRVQGPPNDMPWGQRVGHIQDPDGNAVNLTQPV